ncbi:sugar ABC transporter permease [Staphylococcus caeli]|uniref:Sugar ABC transporter permease n=1 Tax=Staphylococcus caeli TaxID=2201815 RepID=A0A1D4Q0G0_9STAP|nr:sugar ABC transporter permease [Staphylococcus caeli]SCT20811.1 sugar ABC transporter permease [Staphylococcus caeli]SCT28698.1 sugar ABC transporter permease [Staphylococcus caeli]
MIDSMINYFTKTPYLMRHAYHHLKSQWIWLVTPFIVSLLALLTTMVIFKMNGTEEIKQAQGYFKLTAATSFLYIWIAIFCSYKTFKSEYYTGKLFNLNPIFQNIVIALVLCLTMLISLICIIIATPVNIESSIYSTLFFAIMSVFFVVIVSTLLGLCSILNRKVDMVYYVVSCVMFFIVPILFIPNSNTTLLTHILMLNPMYYLIEGFAQSVVLGVLSLNNIPYHLYYLLFLALLCVFIYALYRVVAHKKYVLVNTQKNEDTPKDDSGQHT